MIRCRVLTVQRSRGRKQSLWLTVLKRNSRASGVGSDESTIGAPPLSMLSKTSTHSGLSSGASVLSPELRDRVVHSTLVGFRSGMAGGADFSLSARRVVSCTRVCRPEDGQRKIGDRTRVEAADKPYRGAPG